MPLHRAAGYPGVTAALHRCGDEKSVGVLVFTHQLQTDLLCSSSALARRPASPLQPRGGRRLCGTARHAPCGTRALRRPRLQLGLCACSAHWRKRFQLPVAAAQPRSGGAGRKQLLFLTCLISILPHQHASALLRVHGSAGLTSAQAGTHLSRRLQESPAHTSGISSNPSSWELYSQRISSTNLYSDSGPPPSPLAGVHLCSNSQSLG